MKVFKGFVIVLVLFGFGGHVEALTAREAFQKKVARVAPPSGVRPKGLCACSFDTSEIFRNRVGFIRQVVLNNQVHVQCAGDLFDADGADVGGFSCLDFYPLAK